MPTATPRIDERLLAKINLARGAHADRSNGLCVMEAVAYVAGEAHSDHPECVCPVISTFLRSWNDGLPNDKSRNRLLKPLVPKIVGTRSTKAVEEKRAMMALDWYCRVYVPMALRLVPALVPHAESIEALPEITSEATAKKYAEPNRAARAAAWDAAWDAAGAAAWDAAWDAARAVAWDAARAAAWDAARAAAWAAAGAAARAAGKQALAPAVAKLQKSASKLIIAMAAVKE